MRVKRRKLCLTLAAATFPSPGTHPVSRRPSREIAFANNVYAHQFEPV